MEFFISDTGPVLFPFGGKKWIKNFSQRCQTMTTAAAAAVAAASALRCMTETEGVGATTTGSTSQTDFILSEKKQARAI